MYQVGINKGIILRCTAYQISRFTAWLNTRRSVNPLNVELNPVCHLLALLGAHPILHVSRIRVNFALVPDLLHQTI